MKLVVFGASGNCGGNIVRLASERGHVVTAVVRPETAYSPPSSVRVLRGDVLDEGFVASSLASHDRVVSALGMRYKHPWAARQSPDDFTHKARTGKVRVTDRYAVTATIPREDVAAFLLDEIERERFSARTPMITVT